MSLPYRLLARLLSPAGSRARLSILIFHRVIPETDPLFPLEATAASFDAQMGQVRQAFNVLPLPEAVARLKQGDLPARAACITFDDGYADNLTVAAPILRRHGLPATFFIATAYLDGGRMFNDTVIEAIRRARDARIDLTALGLGEHDVSTPAAKARAIGLILPQVKYLPLGRREEVAADLAQRVADAPLPDDLMMTSAQVKELHGLGMEIGGHTHAHPILAGLDDATVRAEIGAGRERLEALLGDRVRVFAYPNGRPGQDYQPEQAALVRDMGFAGAVSTQAGCATRASDPWQLPRFSPWNPARFMPMLVNNLRSPA
ncbi:MAG: polysaccharide deacetylase family protein [Betaproteobacteria bacterium]|nr:polysaccharide deacetylase family protein [Betaproteobacteria bacterium]